MAITTDVAPEQPDAAGVVTGAKPRAKASRTSRKKRAPRTMKALVVTHRWVSIALGVLLLAITTSGAAVVYEPEWTQWHHRDAFRSTPSDHPITQEQALATVQKAYPDLGAARVISRGGIYDVVSRDYTKKQHVAVDPGTGKINGTFQQDIGVMGFMTNLHECFLACEGEPGYLPFLAKDFPVPSWIGFGGSITGAGIGLIVIGLALAFVSVSGLVIWFPTVKRWAQWARVRWTRGRYARDYDLHNIVGLVAVPFLLMWGFTGASFETPAISNLWYAVTGTHAVPDDAYAFSSDKAPRGTPDITLTQAIAAGERAVGGTPTDVSMPSKDTPYFSLYFDVGVDGYKYGSAPGATAVYVDRHDATHLKVPVDPAAESWISRLWETWRYGLIHYGYEVNAWWRLPWFLLGLTPLLLAWTGMSTWLYTRGVKKRRKVAQAGRLAAQA